MPEEAITLQQVPRLPDGWAVQRLPDGGMRILAPNGFHYRDPGHAPVFWAALPIIGTGALVSVFLELGDAALGWLAAVVLVLFAAERTLRAAFSLLYPVSVEWRVYRNRLLLVRRWRGRERVTFCRDAALRIVSEPDEVRPCSLHLRTADQEVVLCATDGGRLEELRQVGAWMAHHTGWPIALK